MISDEMVMAGAAAILRSRSDHEGLGWTRYGKMATQKYQAEKDARACLEAAFLVAPAPKKRTLHEEMNKPIDASKRLQERKRYAPPATEGET